jgi:hypothetical protein
MKIVILITVIESLVVMLAITYFYYRRTSQGKRALVLRRLQVSTTKQAKRMAAWRLLATVAT